MNSPTGSKHIRKPNTECCICKKPLYRKPKEMEKARYSACMAHRAQAQVVNGITEAQSAGLSRGREKGTNHRAGYKHKQESKEKTSASHKRYCAENPEKVKERGILTRGENHYKWKGGQTKINVMVRRLDEHRKWMSAVKSRDKVCVKCASSINLEAHHIKPLAAIVEEHSVTTRDEARACQPLWDLENGITVCRRCHYGIHGRTYAD